MTVAKLVLSLFPGIDLFGRAFEAEGYTVVRGPDLLFGGRIEDFTPPFLVFEGIIGGSPCQDFSKARRTPPTGDGERLILEFLRCVSLAWPNWFLLENVPQVPDVASDGFQMQRFNLNALDVGSRQNRTRAFQFGHRDGPDLIVPRRRRVTREASRCAMASEGNKPGKRAWSEFCELQGLPPTFDLPGFKDGEKYRAVGNGVPLQMGRAVAAAIRDRSVTDGLARCICGCGRRVTDGQSQATAACRKRMERRRRDAAPVTDRGQKPVTEPGRVTAVTDQATLF